MVKSPHLSIVILQDDVEIGANSCVDRGEFGAMVVGEGAKIDDLCQIAHNCRIARGCVVAGPTVLGGSVTIGDGTQVKGAVAIVEHIRIGAGVKIGGEIRHLARYPRWEDLYGVSGHRWDSNIATVGGHP